MGICQPQRTLTFDDREGSSVVWHSDDEPLCGGRGDGKLFVSMSFGSSPALNWKAKSCRESSHHGDLLIIDGQVQDGFVHCTDLGLEVERKNVAFRWIKRHSTAAPGVVCCLPTCAQGSLILVTMKGRVWPFWVLWVPLVVLLLGGCQNFFQFLFDNLSNLGCLSMSWAEVGSGSSPKNSKTVT